MSKQSFKPGDTVLITGGQYKGEVGTIAEAYAARRFVVVQLSSKHAEAKRVMVNMANIRLMPKPLFD